MAAAVPLLVAALRLVIVSQGDDASLTALLSTLDPIALVLSTALAYLPFVIGVAWYVAADRSARLADSGGLAPAYLRLTITVLKVSMFFALMWATDWFVAAAVVAVLVTWGVTWLRRRRDWYVEHERFAMLTLFALVFSSYIASPDWLQAEKIQTEQDVISSTYYVLEEDEELVTVFTVVGPQVLYLEKDDIEARTICSPGRPSPAHLLLGGSEPTPPCWEDWLQLPW